MKKQRKHTNAEIVVYLMSRYWRKENDISPSLGKINLLGANLRGANLRGAYLQGADLQSADLQGAYLQGADLQSADLQGANLRDANLLGANLRDANLQGADLQGADLQGADLQGAYLQGADLHGAYLQGADLQGANLHGAYLQGAKNIPDIVCAITRIIPDGDIIGHKKGKNGSMITLKILSNTPRSNAAGRKCRCQSALVLRIQDRQGNDISEAVSQHDSNFVYRVGETVSVDNFDTDRWNECSTGIHFFITREEAEAY